LRILLLAADETSAGALARALTAHGHAVVTPREDAPPPGADVVLADARTSPSVADAALGVAPLVLLVRGNDRVDVEWVRRAPAEVLLAQEDGTPAGSWDEAEALLAGARSGAAHRATASRVLDAVESSRSPFLVVTPAGRVEHANPACLRLLGRASLDGLPARLRDLFPTPPSDPATEGLLAAVADGVEWSGEVVVLSAGGDALACEAVVSPVRRPHPRGGDVPEGVVVTLTDVARHHAERATLRDANRLLAERASTDPLCGLYNRAYLQQALDREVARWRRYAQPFTVLMIDLDDFKRVNDLFGHDVGDDVLRVVAGALREGLREGDVLARYGGDEFCALLPGTPLEAARPVADRLRARVAEVCARLETPKRIAASLGIATTDDLRPGADGADLLRLADRAMLAAKRAGGNRCLHRPAAPETAEAAPAPPVPAQTPPARPPAG
jgi:diguanylate cyclase (GGDEF)-like protein